MLSSDGTTVLSAGDTRLEMWRSDMVRMLAYGETDARVKPVNRGLHSGCTLDVGRRQFVDGRGARGLREPEADLKLVLLRPGKEDDEPDSRYVQVRGAASDSGARVLVVSQNHTAVYLPTPQPRRSTWSTTPAPRCRARCWPARRRQSSVVSRAETWSPGGPGMRRGVGSDHLTARYTIAAGETAAPLGPGVMMAGQLLVPVTGAIGVYDPVNGEASRYIPVDRQAEQLSCDSRGHRFAGDRAARRLHRGRFRAHVAHSPR